ncbi:class A beta-lactamase-related serine hydrolase [Oceanobacillus caeni]|uniref:Beta-lactamase class A catalytic domain-containing protein n=1 Tax=Oceanobacillus caeni TaxID=405946 RepID=A0ABR5MFG0_9BACI|nr:MULTISPECIES: serine hydrolase [Bacillaceae]PZD83251.1 hypothetical protein DEJ60_17535 [Bacilli bacterium]KPH70543.1 hypothetical protein AFL42_16655 [Oceanobacillus caeni]MCR1836282.1 class A beta-lactamase-related serine hydrolase [Oceanobacillus caeni]MED4475369.1 serine hydrolase [Oceanobacillus caeni]PZD84789.1 hypothetical protein DEJ66_17525 [Bacilli bacterium]
MKLLKRKPASEKVVDLLINNFNNSSIMLERNGELIVKYREETLLPLASIVKIIIASEFIDQVSRGELDKDEEVGLDIIDRYYIPHSDGGAHAMWKKTLTKTPTLMNICQGMIKFSSNANSEYLLQRLGVQNVNNKLKSFNIKSHDFIYPFSSAGLIPGFLIKKEKLSVRKAIDKLNQISEEEYINLSMEIHKKIGADQEKKFINTYNIFRASALRIQEIQSNKFIRGRLVDYVCVFKELLKNKHHKELFSGILRKESPYKYVAYKGGSTINIINSLMYLEDKEDNNYLLGVFINNTGRKKSNLSLMEFNKKIIEDITYRNDVLKNLESIWLNCK